MIQMRSLTRFNSRQGTGNIRHVNTDLVHDIAPDRGRVIQTSDAVCWCLQTPSQSVVLIEISGSVVSDGGLPRPAHGSTAIGEDCVGGVLEVSDNNGLEGVFL